MTFNEAEKMRERIESYVLGIVIKGMKIDSLWIGPSNWNEVSDYMNCQIQKGQEATLIIFKEKSFSVYGVSIDKISEDVPRHTMINLDNFEKMMCN